MMDDDSILKQLGARARAQEAEKTSEGIPAFDAAAEERIAARLLATTSAKAKPKAPVIRAMRWLYAAMPLAAAAVILLYFVMRGPSATTVPAYEISLVSSSEMRAPEPSKLGAEVVLDPEGELELVARPAAPVKGARARAFLTRTGDTTPWAVPLDVSDQGAVRISGATRTLFPATTGTYGIAILVGNSNEMPSDGEARKLASELAAPSNSGNYRLVRAQVRFAEKK
jgi:hypothetical protein